MDQNRESLHCHAVHESASASQNGRDVKQPLCSLDSAQPGSVVVVAPAHFEEVVEAFSHGVDIGDRQKDLFAIFILVYGLRPSATQHIRIRGHFLTNISNDKLRRQSGMTAACACSDCVHQILVRNRTVPGDTNQWLR